MISSAVRKAGPFHGAGSTGPYTFAFKVLAAADLYVVKLTVATGVETVLALTTHYTVSLNANQNNNPGGTITLVSALAVGYDLTISSAAEALQPVDVTDQGGFYPSVHNDAFDRSTILIQQAEEKLDRSIKYPISDPSTGATLPAYAQRASTVLAFDSSGAPVAGPAVASVGAVFANIANINTVAVIDTEIVAVAANITDVTNFADVYYGPAAADPATRKDGSALQTGDLYFNTVSAAMRVYNTDTSAWAVAYTNAVTFATAAEITAGTEPAKAIAPDQLALSSPTVATVKCTSLTDLKVPKHTSDAVGLADTTITVSANNEVTNASQPAFLAYNSATDADVTGDGTNVTVDFDTEIFDQGGDFANDTFTAPVTGKYQLQTNVYLLGLAAGMSVTIQILTSNQTYIGTVGFNTYANQNIPYQVLADMDAGDTAYVVISVAGGTKVVDVYGTVAPYTNFSGFLAC